MVCSMTVRIAPWLVTVALLCPACTNEDDKTGTSGDNGNNPPPSSWLVGEQGEMLALTTDEDVSTYPLRHASDFNAIECKGAATAWVVGDEGTMLVSRDAGEQWTSIETDVTADLQSIAVAEGLPEGSETLWVAGHEGTVLRSVDGGLAWEPVSGPAVDWSAVATDDVGRLAMFTGLDGSLWRSDGGQALTMTQPATGIALHDVAITHDGDTVVAVGEAGTVLLSHDAGTRFTALAPLTPLDLYALHLGSDGETIVAVGEAGVVLRIDDGGAHLQQTLDDDAALYDLHLRADGQGQAVGSAGAVLRTSDAGNSWRRVQIGRVADLFGVDDFHPAPHL